MSLAFINLHNLKLDCRLVFSGTLFRGVTAKVRVRVLLSMGRISRSLLLAAAVAACARTPSEPLASSTLVGDFGGDQVVLHATSTGAEIQFSCMEVLVSKPLVTDASGYFSAPGGRRRTGGAVPIVPENPTPVRLEGRAYVSQGGTIRLVISDIPEEPGAPITWADTLTLVRDRPARIFLCP